MINTSDGGDKIVTTTLYLQRLRVHTHFASTIWGDQPCAGINVQGSSVTAHWRETSAENNINPNIAKHKSDTKYI